MVLARLAHDRADWTPTLVIAGGVALAFVPFVIALPTIVIAAIWIVSVAARSIAPVHQHCHAHYKIFRHRAANMVYDAVLALAAGNVTAVWELQHVRGHHRTYLERVEDPANNLRFGTSRLVFAVLGDAMSFSDSFALSHGLPRERARLFRQQLFQLAVLGVLIAIDPVLAIALFLVPWLLLRWAVFWFSHAQHHDVPMTNVYDGSVTHFSWTNRFYLNVGHHTAHHEKPTLHWTRLPARSAQIVERIPASCLR